MGKQSQRAASEAPDDSNTESLVLSGHFNYDSRPTNDKVCSSFLTFHLLAA